MDMAGMATRTVDSALGRWTHTTWCPPRLAAVVEHLWHFEGRVTLLRERTFPGGHVELIVHLGPRYRGVDAGGGGATPYPVACVAGVQTTPLVVEAPDAPSCVLGVRLRPVGAYRVLGVPLPALTDATHDLAGVVGHAAAELADRCHDALTAAARFACVATWIEARLARSPARTTAPDARIVRAAAQLERSHGATPVGALRDAAGLGRTRFAAAFRAHVGLAPKRYARVLRFRHALTLLHGAPPASAAPGGRIAALALAAGYYDQAHLDAEFRVFAGMPPSAYLRALRYDGAPSLPEPG
jgi:AraC-like DNA-binding protein